VVWVNKPVGMTPFECVMRYKKDTNTDDDTPIAFVGRLDPIAYGLMPLIINPKINVIDIQPHYKTYRFKFICGVQTDTGDILGVVKTPTLDPSLADSKLCFDSLLRYVSRKSQAIPLYSSKNIANATNRGKDNTGLLSLSSSVLYIQSRDIDIRYINVSSSSRIKTIDNIIKKLQKRRRLISPKHSFRYDEIIESWGCLLANKVFNVLDVEACVSSGTYIRSMCDECGGVAYDICRIRYGLDTDIINMTDLEPSKYEFKILRHTSNIEKSTL